MNRISTCLAFEALFLDSSCFIAACLSIHINIGSRTRSFTSFNYFLVPSSSRLACEAKLNSASIVLTDTPYCFLYNYRITAPFNVSTHPDTGLRSVLSAAKSASLQHLICTLSVVGSTPIRCNLSFFVIFKYLMIRLAVFQSLVIGLQVCLAALCTTKLVSGCVHLTIDCRLLNNDLIDFKLGSPFALLVVRKSLSLTSSMLHMSPIVARTPFADSVPNFFITRSIVTA